MLSIPIYIYLVGAFIAWAGLMLTWSKHIHDIAEQRRLKAVAQGETAQDVRGVSNYERAELRESAHRASKVMPRERWIGRVMFLGIPVIILTIFFASTPL